MRADFALDYDVLTVEQPQKLYLMARFESGDAPGDSQRRPLNLSLVIDRSGSMAGDKIDYTRQAAQFLVQHLGMQDRFSVVLYNDKIETLIEPQTVTNKDHIIQQLEAIRVRGTTNLSGGWLEGCMHVKAHQSPSLFNRVIVMTDGLANRGITEAAQLTSIARQKREEGISTTTMGLGLDFNEDLLMDLANAGGGAFYFIESPEVAPEIFQEELSGLLNIVGQNLTISVSPSSHVTNIQQLNAYPTETAGKSTVYRLGDVFGNETKTLLLELSIPALNSIGEVEIAKLRFQWDKINGGATATQNIEIPVMVNVHEAGAEPASPNAEVTEQVLLLKAAHARQEAIKAADAGRFDEASQHLTEVANVIADSPVMNNNLEEERDALLKQANDLKQGDKYNGYSRKTMSTQAFYTMSNRHGDTMMLRIREKERSSDDQSNTGLPLTVNTLDEQPLEPKVESKPGITPSHVRISGELHQLAGDLIRLGRAAQNDIPITSKGVSRFHCQIMRVGNNLVIEDLNSTNGTHINGNPLRVPHTLSVGDVVQISDQRLIFILLEQPEQSRPETLPEDKPVKEEPPTKPD